MLLSTGSSVFAEKQTHVIYYHDVVLSETLTSRDINHASDPLNIQLSSMGRDMTLRVSLSATTNATTFSSGDSIDTSNGSEQTSPPDNLSVLAGVVVGDETSWVRVVIDQGVMTGHLQTFGTVYEIELASRLQLTDTTTTVIFPTDARTLPDSSAGPVDSIAFAPAPPLPVINQPHIQTDNTAIKLQRINATQVQRAIRIGVVVDSRFNEFYDGRGLARALSIVNTVDGIYQDQLGVAVLLEHVHVMDDADTDPLRSSNGSIEDLLGTFTQLRQSSSWLSHDLTLVHLLSGLEDPEAVIGLGWITTACRTDGYDVSVSTPFAYDGLLAAHEMAHNLGAFHDDDPQCEANASNIMWPRLSGRTSTTFSQCSIDSMAPQIAASCNLDNIDIAVSLHSDRASSDLQRQITVQVNNLDQSRSANDVLTHTELPPTSTVTNLDSRCELEGSIISCAHDVVPALDQNVVSFSVTVPGITQQQIVSEVIPGDFADVGINNNRVALNILQSDSASGGGMVIDDAPTQLADGSGAQSGGGGGKTDQWMLLLLFASVWLRRKKHA